MENASVNLVGGLKPSGKYESPVERAPWNIGDQIALHHVETRSLDKTADQDRRKTCLFKKLRNICWHKVATHVQLWSQIACNTVTWYCAYSLWGVHVTQRSRAPWRKSQVSRISPVYGQWNLIWIRGIKATKGIQKAWMTAGVSKCTSPWWHVGSDSSAHIGSTRSETKSLHLLMGFLRCVQDSLERHKAI